MEDKIIHWPTVHIVLNYKYVKVKKYLYISTKNYWSKCATFVIKQIPGSGWSDFEKNPKHSMLCQIVENLDCYPKISQTNCLEKLFQAGDRGEPIQKLKMERNSKKYLFWPCTDQKQFCPLSENKK